MEKKFKHRTTGEIATYKDGVLKSSGCCVEIGVEPSKEFWEEILPDLIQIQIKDTLLDFNTEFYVVNNWQVQKAYAGITFKDQDKWGKYSFLSQGEAESYIIWNKPCLSINDIKGSLVYNIELEKLKSIVKQRL